MSASYAVGIDAGGTNVKGLAVDSAGTVVVRRLTPIGDRTLPDAVIAVVADILGELPGAPDALGLAAPGIASEDGRSIWWMQGRRDELQGLDWSKHLGRRQPVHVMNDAQAALLGEVWKGAAEGCENVIMLTLGTGVGGAAMVDGRLLGGHLGRAGHLGHISLDPSGPPDIVNTPGSLEAAIGECTLEQRSGGRFRSTADLLASTHSDAESIWATSVRALACGLASLVNVLDPERAILGGGMIAAGERLFTPLRAEMEKVEWRPHGRAVQIVPALAGEYAGALGAAFNALKKTSGVVLRRT